MRATSLTLTMGVISTMLFSECDEDNYNTGYNSYENRNNYNKKMDYVEQDTAYQASGRENEYGANPKEL